MAMDHMERFKIQGSLKRAIAILDSTPPQRDIVPEANIVNLVDPLSTAHIAIERGLKSLISDSGRTFDYTHDLNGLYQCLGNCNQEIFRYLANAFDDAVKFFGYDVKAEGFKQFQLIDEYLSKVGSAKSFQALRYWAIEEPNQGYKFMSYISPQIHRELLWALWIAFFPKRRDTVSIRVERDVARAIERQISVAFEDECTEHPTVRYMNWMTGKHRTHCGVLGDLVRTGFDAIGDAYLEKALRKAYDDLRQSADPALRYYLGTLTYLAKGSQRRSCDAIPLVKWSGSEMVACEVISPGGTSLGFLEKCADGAWAITPSEEGLVQITDIAEDVADAKHYLVNRLSRPALCIINSARTQLRVCISDRLGFHSSRSDRAWSASDTDLSTAIYEIEFWDARHGIERGDRVSIGVVFDEADSAGSVLYGTVDDVENHKVSIVGSDVWTSKQSLEEWLVRTSYGSGI